MTDSDRRAYERHDVQLSVRLADEDRKFSLVSENLSLGGIFLRCEDEPVEAGAMLKLTITVPAADGVDEEAAVEGEVAQVVPGAGIGIAFSWSEATEGERDKLRGFIRRAGMLDDDVVHTDYVGLSTDAIEVVKD
jgi:hypothetical protein